MAKFYGVIGYAIQTETAPGVWQDSVVERNYRGDIVLNQIRWQPSDKVNDNLNIDNSISIIADPFLYANSGCIKYVVWMNKKWKIQSFSINRPRVVLQLGGLYNE